MICYVYSETILDCNGLNISPLLKMEEIPGNHDSQDQDEKIRELLQGLMQGRLPFKKRSQSIYPDCFSIIGCMKAVLNRALRISDSEIQRLSE